MLVSYATASMDVEANNIQHAVQQAPLTLLCIMNKRTNSMLVGPCYSGNHVRYDLVFAWNQLPVRVSCTHGLNFVALK